MSGRLPLVTMTAQRHNGDCGAAALSMLLGESYEHVLLAFEAPRVLSGGVWGTEIIRVAAQFSVRLRRARRWSVETHEGIVWANNYERSGAPHVAVLRAGLIFDTDLTVWRLDEWKAAKRVKTLTLFRIVAED